MQHGSFDVYTFRSLIFEEAANYLGIDDDAAVALFKPEGFGEQCRYPAHRVIATLKRLRDTYLATVKS